MEMPLSTEQQIGYLREYKQCFVTNRFGQVVIVGDDCENPNDDITPTLVARSDDNILVEMGIDPNMPECIMCTYSLDVPIPDCNSGSLDELQSILDNEEVPEGIFLKCSCLNEDVTFSVCTTLPLIFDFDVLISSLQTLDSVNVKTVSKLMDIGFIPKIS